MERLVTINQAVVGGYEKELIEKLLPQLSHSFTQRKEFWEYYFNETRIELTLDDLSDISSHFCIRLCYDELEIEI